MGYGRVCGVVANGVVLLLADSGTGLLWLRVVAEGEKSAESWQRLLVREVAQVGAEASQDMVEQVRERVRAVLATPIHGGMDVTSYERAEQRMVTLLSHPRGKRIGQFLNEQPDHLLVHRLPCYRGLQRVTPEWYWRDFRLRLSRGLNHGSERGLERAALV